MGQIPPSAALVSLLDYTKLIECKQALQLELVVFVDISIEDEQVLREPITLPLTCALYS